MAINAEPQGSRCDLGSRMIETKPCSMLTSDLNAPRLLETCCHVATFAKNVGVSALKTHVLGERGYLCIHRHLRTSNAVHRSAILHAER